MFHGLYSRIQKISPIFESVNETLKCYHLTEKKDGSSESIYVFFSKRVKNDCRISFLQVFVEETK